MLPGSSILLHKELNTSWLILRVKKSWTVSSELALLANSTSLITAPVGRVRAPLEEMNLNTCIKIYTSNFCDHKHVNYMYLHIQYHATIIIPTDRVVRY